MRVHLVSVTPRAEDLIVYCARVSSPQNQTNLLTAPKLLRFLIDHKHWSPFEMADMTVEIETSRAIAAQLLRHKSFSFQEFSQRYAEADLGFETHEARRQDAKNRQASIDDLPASTREWFANAQLLTQDSCLATYREALEHGIAKELARFLLPLSTTTRLYMKGSARSWIHYLEVRLDRATQKEHRDIAKEIWGLFGEHFPVSRNAIESCSSASGEIESQ